MFLLLDLSKAGTDVLTETCLLIGFYMSMMTHKRFSIKHMVFTSLYAESQMHFRRRVVWEHALEPATGCPSAAKC